VLAGVIGYFVGIKTGAYTTVLAEKLGQRFLERPQFASFVATAFANTFAVDGPKRAQPLLKYCLLHPAETIDAFRSAFRETLGENALDAIKAFFFTGEVPALTDIAIDEVIEFGKSIAEGLNRISEIVSERGSE